MTPPPTAPVDDASRALDEYHALRATIRDRGTARVWVFVVGLSAWACLTLATAALVELPIATLLPLLVLAATFEAVYSLHVGVERVGRYLQVFFEGDTPGAHGGGNDAATAMGWEHAVMAFGRLAPSSGAARVDALFAAYFVLATALNFIPAVLATPLPLEYGVVGALHLVFVARIGLARRQAGRQRAVDLDLFRRVRAEAAGTPPPPSV